MADSTATELLSHQNLWCVWGRQSVVSGKHEQKMAEGFEHLHNTARIPPTALASDSLLVLVLSPDPPAG